MTVGDRWIYDTRIKVWSCVRTDDLPTNDGLLGTVEGVVKRFRRVVCVEMFCTRASCGIAVIKSTSCEMNSNEFYKIDRFGLL